MLAFFRVLALMHPLAGNVLKLPDPPPPSIAYVHALHAEAASTSKVPASLLLAIAYKESRYDPRAKPQCGVTQIAALKDRPRCALLRRNNQAAYDLAVIELEAWLEVTRGNLPHALSGYGAGWDAAHRKPAAYALNTLRLAKRLGATAP